MVLASLGPVRTPPAAHHHVLAAASVLAVIGDPHAQVRFQVCQYASTLAAPTNAVPIQGRTGPPATRMIVAAVT